MINSLLPILILVCILNALIGFASGSGLVLSPVAEVVGKPPDPAISTIHSGSVVSPPSSSPVSESKIMVPVVQLPVNSRTATQVPSATPTETPSNLSGITGMTGYAPDRVIVRYKTSGSFTAQSVMEIQATANSGIGAKVLSDEEELGVEGLQVVQLLNGTSVQSAISYYSANPSVEYAEPDYLVSAFPGSEKEPAGF